MCDVDILHFQARVAELEGEIAEMKTALSEAEHDRQRIYQELSKVT